MTEPHKRPHRHPTYKTPYRVKNWHAYDQSLCDRGDITLWISQDAIDAWSPPMTGTRGAQPVYADIAMETALTFRLLFHLPLRQTEGFLRAVLQRMGLTLPCPDHTTLSRRNATVDIGPLKNGVQQEPTCLIVDSSGLQVCGQGAWQTQKHGEKQHKRWKKRHIGVDTQGRIVASTVTESQEQDPSQVPALWSQVDREIDRFIGDGMYDQAPVYAAVMVHSPGASVIIPPRKDAVLSDQAATFPTQRDQHLLAIERAGRFAWKRTSGYYAQSHAENAFFRFKQVFGGRLRAKRDASQERETSLACALLNRMRDRGRPESYAVS
jgi:transposase